MRTEATSDAHPSIRGAKGIARRRDLVEPRVTRWWMHAPWGVRHLDMRCGAALAPRGANCRCGSFRTSRWRRPFAAVASAPVVRASWGASSTAASSSLARPAARCAGGSTGCRAVGARLRGPLELMVFGGLAARLGHARGGRGVTRHGGAWFLEWVAASRRRRARRSRRNDRRGLALVDAAPRPLGGARGGRWV